MVQMRDTHHITQLLNVWLSQVLTFLDSFEPFVGTCQNADRPLESATGRQSLHNQKQETRWKKDIPPGMVGRECVGDEREKGVFQVWFPTHFWVDSRWGTVDWGGSAFAGKSVVVVFFFV